MGRRAQVWRQPSLWSPSRLRPAATPLSPCQPCQAERISLTNRCRLCRLKARPRKALARAGKSHRRVRHAAAKPRQPRAKTERQTPGRLLRLTARGRRVVPGCRAASCLTPRGSCRRSGSGRLRRYTQQSLHKPGRAGRGCVRGRPPACRSRGGRRGRRAVPAG